MSAATASRMTTGHPVSREGDRRGTPTTSLSSASLSNQKNSNKATTTTKIQSTPPKEHPNGKNHINANKFKRITPQAVQAAAESSSRCTVDKNVVNELLLVCSVLGSHDDETGQLVPVEDCLEWLQDLQRAVRRDDDATRPICLLLGHWNVVSSKLVPLAVACRYDTAIVLTVCKILVLLTKPLATATVRAAKLPIDTKSQKVSPAVLQEQIKLRDNALQQAEQLLEFKKALCTPDFLQVLVSLTAAPLSQARRTERDHLTLEVVLHLLRNLLQAQPILAPSDGGGSSRAGSSSSSSSHTDTHHLWLKLLDQELVLDILCVMAADVDQPSSPNAPYNLLLMEILQHLLLPYKVEHIIMQAGNESGKSSTSKSNKSTVGAKGTTINNKSTIASNSLLRSSLQRQRQAVQAMRSARHGNFGGTFVSDDTGAVVSTTQYAQSTLGHNVTSSTAAPPTTQLANIRGAVFIGATRSAALATGPSTPAARQACAVLHRFCRRFITECWGAFTKSIKNEFRRDSVRLEDGDRVVWFQLAAFMSQFWRGTIGKSVVAKTTRKSKQKDSLGQKQTEETKGNILGPLLFSMDVFSFHLVHNAMDTFMQHKQYGKLAFSVRMLREMMYLLQTLYGSDDETEQIMAMGLMDRLFYGSEPLDRLPKLLSHWQPGQATHQYAADLAELVHTQLKLLEQHAAASADVAGPNHKKKQRTKKDSAPTDTIIKMKLAAADFDVSYYFRKLVSPHTIYLYTQLLANYAVNGARLNHRIVSFLLRVSQFTVHVPEDLGEEQQRNPLAPTRRATLEPLLFNVRLLWVLHVILNDKTVDDETVTNFALRTVNHFAQMAAENPMLVVEATVKHAVPHRYCQAVSNWYVSEELIMLAERDMLLEEQQQWEEEQAADDAADMSDEDDGDVKDTLAETKNRRPRPRKQLLEDSDSEDELEFDDAVVEAVPQKRKVLDDDDDDYNNNSNQDKQSGSKKGKSRPSKKSRLTNKRKMLNLDDSDSENDHEAKNLEKRVETDSGKQDTEPTTEKQRVDMKNGDENAEEKDGSDSDTSPMDAENSSLPDKGDDSSKDDHDDDAPKGESDRSPVQAKKVTDDDQILVDSDEE